MSIAIAALLAFLPFLLLAALFAVVRQGSRLAKESGRPWSTATVIGAIALGAVVLFVLLSSIAKSLD